MKILHLIFTMKTGGTESMLVDIANEQSRMGHDVSVMVINRGSEPDLLAQFDSGVKIMEMNRRLSSRNPIPVVRTNLAVMKLNPDVIHVHNERGVNILMPLLRRRIIQTVHTTGIGLQGCQRQTPIVAISQAVADDLKSRCGLESEVVMNGIRTDEIKRRQPSERFDRVVCVGRLDVAVKGQDLLLKTLTCFPDLTLSLIGDGESMEGLKYLARDLRVASRVEFLGKMSRGEIYETLKDYDMFVLPSRQEGFGLVLAEAMAAGLPVVTSALPGPMEVIDGGRLGYIFEPDSSRSLAEALQRLVNNRDDAQRIALTEGIDFVAQNFSVTKTASRYIDLYGQYFPARCRV